ncbi:MAG: FAD binding domain-containing protein [Anaerolineae bacterium]|nr:FAD binding domain-containing protein [Anaerolineae bacterium]
MLPNLQTYHRPTTLEEAIRLIQPPGTVPIGGGTLLIPSRDPAVEAVVDLSGLGLTYIREEETGWAVGATTTLQQMLESPALRERTQGLIAEAARLTASRNLRGQATIGGIVAAGGFESPILTLLLALDTIVTFYAPERRQMPLDQFLWERGDILRRGALITELCIPQPTGLSRMGMAFVNRTPRDRPIVCAVVETQWAGEKCVRAHIALGGVAERPIRARRAEEALQGREWSPEVLDQAAALAAEPLNPPTDFRGSREYRRAMARVLVHRALREVLKSDNMPGNPGCD